MFLNFPFRSRPLIAKLLHPPFLKQKSYSKMKAIAVIFRERTSAHPEIQSLRWKLLFKLNNIMFVDLVCVLPALR